jgi:nitrile hydratase
MDGIHDLGGVQNCGRVVEQDDAPLRHEWEWRMLGIVRALARPADWNIDKFRFTREQLPPAEYLTRSYFDQWYRSYAAMLLGSQLVTAQELGSGESAQSISPVLKPSSVADVPKLKKVSVRFDRPYEGKPRFGVGDRVRATLTGSPGHTRLPKYVRGHAGVIRAYNGAHIVPDENAEGREFAEPLYSVTFGLAELFPEQSGSGDKVHLDLWERYLELVQ